MIVHYRKSILIILIQGEESINYYNMTTKDELQDYAVKLIETNLNDNLLLSWATGLGKSLAFIKIQEAHYKNEITYIIVNERNHIQNWKNEYIKYGKEELLKNTKIFCYASLKKYLNKKIGLLGLDEAHHALSPARIEFLNTLEVKKTVALTATLTTMQKELLIDLFGNFVEHKFLLKKATENNILVQPKIYLIGLDLVLNQKTGETHSKNSASGTIKINLNENQSRETFTVRGTTIKVKNNSNKYVLTTPLFYSSIKSVEDKLFSKSKEVKK